MTTTAVRPASGLSAAAWTRGFPSFWGSASDRASERPSARKRTTKRCSLPGVSAISTPSCLGSFALSRAHRRSFSAGRDAAGPAVRDQSRLERGEIAAGDDVVPSDLDPGSEGLQDAAPELVSQRVVAEQPEVGRPGAGRDAHEHRVGHAAGAEAGDLVQVGFLRRFELGPAVDRQAAEPVADEEDDLGIRRERQFLRDIFPVHSTLNIKGCRGPVNLRRTWPGIGALSPPSALPASSAV